MTNDKMTNDVFLIKNIKTLGRKTLAARRFESP